MKPINIVEIPPSEQRSPQTQKGPPGKGDVAYLVRPETPPPVVQAPEKNATALSPKNCSKYVLLAILIIAALAAIAYGATQWLLGPKVVAYAVAKGDVLQTIVASGRVETPLRIDIGTQITGNVAAIPVQEGQVVKAGQLLIALEDSEAKASVAAARAAVVQAEARLKQIRVVILPNAEQALARAKASLLNSKRQYDRLKELKVESLVSQSQVDDAATALELAESDAHAAQIQVDTNRADGADYWYAQTALDQARANLTSSLSKLNYAKIVAPTDGTLIARNVERGDVVQPGKALMVLSPAGQTQLVVQIDEKNLASLSLGQSALASADAYPNLQFPAKVAYINPGVDATRGSVLVKLDVSQLPDYLRQDMTVSVDIEVAHHQNTLVLAADAVHNGASAAPWVFRVNDGKVQRQAVEVGARGAGKVEILRGLQAGDVALSSTSANLTEGKRVRAQQTKSQTAQ